VGRLFLIVFKTKKRKNQKASVLPYRAGIFRKFRIREGDESDFTSPITKKSGDAFYAILG
jgi:hypothetical protein